MGQAGIQRRQLPAKMASELRKVSIRHLPVPDHPVQSHIDERQAVRPELVTIGSVDSGDDVTCGRRGISVSQQKAKQTALGYRAGRERRGRCRQPLRGPLVVHMFNHDQRDQHVRIEQCSHSSSSNDRTSSDVTIVPTLTVGNPVRGSVAIVAVLVLALRPRLMRSATVSLKLRWVSRAIAWACLCRSSGKSTVVRIVKSIIAS